MKDGKLDINTLVGLLLIGAILLGFSFFRKSPEPKPASSNTEQLDSTAEQVSNSSSPSSKIVQDTFSNKLADSSQTLAFGSFGMANNPQAKEEIFSLENDLLELKISSKGGQIVSARLKNYKTWDSLDLYLIKQNSALDIKLNADGKSYSTSNLNFVGSKSNGDVIMTLNSENGGELSYRYHINSEEYLIEVDMISRDFEEYLPSDLALTWEMKTLRHEKNKKAEALVSELNYRFAKDDDMDYLSAGSDDEAEEMDIKWLAYKQQFFSSILWNKSGSFEKVGMISKVVPEENEEFTKVFASKMALDKTGGELSLKLGLYLGPNKYERLQEHGQGFEKLIPLGWGILGWINRGLIINVFNFLESKGFGYGMIILIIALLIKLILFPLTFSSYKSMAKMRVLKPEIDELNEKFKGKDAMKKQQATMQLYQKAGVNPLGGCIPMVLQFPILIALFRFFPASIELRQQDFLWATDLSTYDSIYDFGFNIPFYGDHISLFTLLMTVSTLIYTYMNQQLTGQNQQFPQLKYMVYLMPIVFLGVFNNYAAGLSYYYFLANMITFGQQFAIRRWLNEDKILQKIKEKKEKPKKENRFMRRMKEIQEQQEEQKQSRGDRRKK